MKALAKTYINTNLRRLDVLFKAAINPRDTLFLSKLAILELCGWIEISMDAIVRRCAKKNLKLQASRQSAEAIIQRTYSFDYQQHFRKMLIQVKPREDRTAPKSGRVSKINGSSERS